MKKLIVLLVLSFILTLSVSSISLISQNASNNKGTGLSFNGSEYNKAKSSKSLSTYAIQKSIIPAHYDWAGEMPTVGDQGSQNSSTAWAVGYVYKSYQEQMEHDWGYDKEHLVSPAYIYNSLNNGRDRGLTFIEVFEFLKNEGSLTLSQMPYNQYDYNKKPPKGYNYIKEQYKIAGYKRLTERFGNLTKDETFELRETISKEGPVLIGTLVPKNKPDWSALVHNDNNYVIDENEANQIYDAYLDNECNGIALTVVGYDDEYIETDYDYKGAFKVMNNWGTDWGDDGYFWITYDAFQIITMEVYSVIDKPNDPSKNNEASIDVKILVKKSKYGDYETWDINYDEDKRFFTLNKTFKQSYKFRVKLRANDNYSLYFVNLGTSGNLNKLYPYFDYDTGFVVKDKEYLFFPNNSFSFDDETGRELFIIILSQTDLTELLNTIRQESYNRKDIYRGNSYNDTAEIVEQYFPELNNIEGVAVYTVEMITTD